MKRIIALLLCVACFSLLLGCSPKTGYMTYTGIFVKTNDGQNILIYSVEGHKKYYLLQESETCKSFEDLKTGDKVTIYCPCLADENTVLSEKTVYEWERNIFGHIDVSSDTRNNIDTLLANRNQ